jgi:ATP-dependent Lon protease
VTLDTKTLRALIEGYARDAGVRRLEKQLGKIVRKVAVRMLEGERHRSASARMI